MFADHYSKLDKLDPLDSQTHRQTQRSLRLNLEVELLLPTKRVKTN